MPTFIRESGATILELTIAVVMMSILVIGFCMSVQKTSVSMVSTRRHAWAVDFGAARVNELKALPYYDIPLTPSGSFSGGVTSCDCSQQDLTLLTPDATFKEDGVVYTRYVCTNLIKPASPGPGWTTDCPVGNNDALYNMKNIRVRVAWGTNSKADIEQMVARP